MHAAFPIFIQELHHLHTHDEGQDLVEYALVLALIALGTTAGMQEVAAGLNAAFFQVSSTLGNYIS